MAAPFPPTKPSLSISSGSSSFQIRANPTLDSDVESSSTLNNGSDSDFELQGSDSGENEFQSPAFDNQPNPKEKAVVFDGDKLIDSGSPASLAQDSDIEESLRSGYSSTQEDVDEEEEEDGDSTESDYVVGKVNEVIPIRARLTRESDDDDISIESGEIDDDYGFLSAVRMPVRVSSITAIDFEEDDSDFEIEPPPPPESEKILFLSEQSTSTKESESEDAISFLEAEEDESVFAIENADPEPPIIDSSIEAANIEQTLVSEIAASGEYCSEHPPVTNQQDDSSKKDDELLETNLCQQSEEDTTRFSSLENQFIDSIIQEPNLDENVSVKTHCLNPIASEDARGSEKDDQEPNLEESNFVKTHYLNSIASEDPCHSEKDDQEPNLDENVSVKTHCLNPIASEDPQDSEKDDQEHILEVNVSVKTHCLNPIASEDPCDSEKDDQEPNLEETVSVKTHCLNPTASEDPHDSEKEEEDKDGTSVGRDWADLNKPNEDERKRLVKFFRFVLRLGLSPEDSLIEEVLFHRLKNSNLESAKEEATHLEQQQESDLDPSLNILVIGKTGVGKSATINSIFGQEIAKVDAFQPGTKSVTAIPGWINTVELTVFDTPGFRPSPSEHSINTKILSSIKKAIRNSPPDIVLYVDRFDEQTADQDNSTLLRSISSSLGSSIWNSTMVVFTHAASNPLDQPSQAAFKRLIFDDRRVSLVENNNPFNIERWRIRLLLLGYSMKLLLLSSETELAYPVYRNRFLPLLEKDYTIGEDGTLMSLFVMKMKMEFEARLSKSKGGKVLFRIKSTDQQLQISLLSMISIANVVFRRIFTDSHKQ